MPLHKVNEKMIAEMYRLRKEGGYSNQEIANHFGLAHQTVLRTIGREPGRAYKKDSDDQQRAEQKPTVVANLKTVSKNMVLQGANNSYTVNVSDGVCFIQDVLYDRYGLEVLKAEIEMIIAMIDKEKKND